LIVLIFLVAVGWVIKLAVDYWYVAAPLALLILAVSVPTYRITARKIEQGILERDGSACAKCGGRRDLLVVRRNRKQPPTDENLWVICKSCFRREP
jgi:hypothetical protein